MITIDFNQIARAGKFLALIGFFLPWVTVSCSGTEILTATGWQLMAGDPQPAGPMAGMGGERELDDAEPSILVIAAFGVLLIGIATGLMTRKHPAAASMLVAALLSAGLAYASIANMRGEMQRELSEQQQGAGAESPFFGVEQQREMGRAIASSIRIEEEEGYWLTLAGLALAALFSGLTLATARAPAARAPEAP